MKFGYEHEEAVSPVIGVILMVAITVILAATVGVFVLGMGSDMSGSKEAYLTASTNSSATTIVLQSGKDISALESIKVKVSGKSIDAMVNATKKLSEVSSFTVGDVITMSEREGTLVVSGKFKDGKEQVLLQKNL